ncbi:helix-turn-helix domain-containing protein, partial [Clostridium tarantellae]|nr:helix-turn-helix domain-containing protein [Clostridium tarantellae]MPQ44937.1 helix-turn-helix domain-containing protein [Clostridium tarantellae]
MKKLLKAYKIEVKPTKKQTTKIHETIGICRYIY